MHLRRICKALGGSSLVKNVMKNQTATFYAASEAVNYPENVKIIDFRSDTLTLPTKEMQNAMFSAQVGDDVYKEDPTVNALEELGARMLGKEAAMFVPSGTMANLLALMTHSEIRGAEVVVGDESHILMWEQAGAAHIAGIQLRSVKNHSNGSYDIGEMLYKIRDKGNSLFPKTTLVCVENTHNSCGGRVAPISWLREMAAAVKPLGIPLHMDGARLFNSVVSSGLDVKEVTRDMDSVNVCLSKGLGAPIGSLLIGSDKFMKRARFLRKAIGGGMRQAGFVAAAGAFALENMVDRLKEDHVHTRMIAEAIHETGSKVISVDLSAVETNILFICVDTSKLSAADLCQRLATVSDEELQESSPSVVKILPWSNGCARVVTCLNNTRDDVERTIKKFQHVISEFDAGVLPKQEKLSSSMKM